MYVHELVIFEFFLFTVDPYFQFFICDEEVDLSESIYQRILRRANPSLQVLKPSQPKNHIRLPYGVNPK